jgi:hypothetical protein
MCRWITCYNDDKTVCAYRRYPAPRCDGAIWCKADALHKGRKAEIILLKSPDSAIRPALCAPRPLYFRTASSEVSGTRPSLSCGMRYRQADAGRSEFLGLFNLIRIAQRLLRGRLLTKINGINLHDCLTGGKPKSAVPRCFYLVDWRGGHPLFSSTCSAPSLPVPYQYAGQSASGVQRRLEIKSSAVPGTWRKREGVEPTKDRLAAPPGFEVRTPHRGRFSS